MAQENLQRALGRVEGKVDLVVQSIADLKNSFEKMEQGRLSKLEVDFATLHTNVTGSANNHAIWTAAIMTTAGSIVSGIILFLLLKHYS